MESYLRDSHFYFEAKSGHFMIWTLVILKIRAARVMKLQKSDVRFERFFSKFIIFCRMVVILLQISASEGSAERFCRRKK